MLVFTHTPKVDFDNNRHREFQKAKPPTFDGEVKSRQEVEALLVIIKYFQVHNYCGNMKAIAAISNFNG